MAYFSKTKKIICRNSYGYRLEFGYSFPFYLNSYSGIHNYDGNVATIKSAFGVGVSYIGTSVNARSINLVIAFKDGSDLVTRKQQIYNKENTRNYSRYCRNNYFTFYFFSYF